MRGIFIYKKGDCIVAKERKLFGTDGVRDLANSGNMTPELALRLGRAFIRFTRGKKIVIGCDTRLSGRMLEGALYSGMSSEGAEIYLAGIIPTPGVSYAVKALYADGGAVISASHNPAEYNGIKFLGADGCKLSDESEADVEEILFRDERSTSQNIGAGKVERVPLVFRTAVTLVSLAGLTLGIITYSFGEPLLSIYTDNPKVVEAGMIRMAFMCIPYFLCGIQNVIPGTARGMGYSIVPTFITVIGVCALRIVWIATVCQLPECSTIEWVYASYPFSWAVTSVSHYIYYKIAYRKTLKQFRAEAVSA